MELPYFNSLGGFTPDGREYVIYLGPGTHTPAPWVNVIANPTFGTLVSETGSGFTWYGNSQRNRLTQWSNDPVMDPPSEALYIRDEETGVFWTPTPSPIREETRLSGEARGGLHGIRAQQPRDRAGADGLRPRGRKGGRTDQAAEAAAEERLLQASHAFGHLLCGVDAGREPRVLPDARHDLAGMTKSQAVIARNRYHPEYGDRVAFAAISPPADSYSGDRTSFLGRNRSWREPGGDGAGRVCRAGRGRDSTRAPRCRRRLSWLPARRPRSPACWARPGSVEEARRLVLDLPGRPGARDRA